MDDKTPTETWTIFPFKLKLIKHTFYICISCVIIFTATFIEPGIYLYVAYKYKIEFIQNIITILNSKK